MAVQTQPSPGVDPTSLILGLGGGLANGIAGSIANINNQNRQAQAQQEANQLSRDTNTLDVAKSEETLDPFRQQMDQAGDLAKLDQLQHASFHRVNVAPDPMYASSVPQVSGGFSYEKSPQLLSDAAALQKNIEGGNVAPTMTDPTNYGKTGTLNLLQIAADGKDPGTVSGAAGAPLDPASYLTGVPQRTAGGIGTASTRGTDVSVASATDILTKAIQENLGRNPNPGEIAAMLAGQGLKPGDQWVGQTGLMGVLSTITSQGHPAGAAPSYTGRG